MLLHIMMKFVKFYETVTKTVEIRTTNSDTMSFNSAKGI